MQKLLSKFQVVCFCGMRSSQLLDGAVPVTPAIQVLPRHCLVAVMHVQCPDITLPIELEQFQLLVAVSLSKAGYWSACIVIIVIESVKDHSMHLFSTHIYQCLHS